MQFIDKTNKQCNIFIIIPSSHQHILLICRIGLLSIQQFQILPACPHIYHVGLSRQYLFKYIRVSDPSELTYFPTSNMEMLVPPQTRQDLCYITWCLSLKGCPTNEMHVVQLNKGKTSISTSSGLLNIVNLFLVLPIDPWAIEHESKKYKDRDWTKLINILLNICVSKVEDIIN